MPSFIMYPDQHALVYQILQNSMRYCMLLISQKLQLTHIPKSVIQICLWLPSPMHYLEGKKLFCENSLQHFWFLADMEKVSSSLAVLAEKSRKSA